MTIDPARLSFTLDTWEKHHDNPEKRALNKLRLLGEISEEDNYSPSKAKDCHYTSTLRNLRKENPEIDQYIDSLVTSQLKKENDKKKKRARQKTLSHTKAMACFEKCVKVQAKKERNTFRRKARLLKAAKDLKLSAFIKRDEISQLVLQEKDSQQGHGFQLLSAADRIAMETPVTHWLLPGLVPAQDLTIIGGRPKVGKTRFAVAIAAAVLNGTSVLDLPAPSTQKPVILCSDDQADGDTCEMLSALNLWKHPNLSWSRHFRLNESDLDKLLEAIKANPGALVIIDSLRSISRCLRHGENDPEIGATLYDLKQAVTDAGGTLLLVHHCNKSNDLVGVEALSGHNAIAGAANGVLTMHYLEEKNGQPNKQAPQRRLVREARSGDGFDLVIDRDAAAGFRRVSDVGEWKQQQEEASNREKLSTLQEEVLDALETQSGQWMTRREVCEAIGIEWIDRGKAPGAKKVERALTALRRNGMIESQRVGLESTFRFVASRETQNEVSSASSSSDTSGSEVTTPNVVSVVSVVTDPEEKSLTTRDVVEVSSREALQLLGDDGDDTDPQGLEPEEKLRRRTQLALDVPLSVAVGSGADVSGDADDPHWPKRKEVA